MKEKRTSVGWIEKVVVSTGVGTMAVGLGLLIAGIAIPPAGEINNSVLVAFGEASTFSGALLGVMKKKEKIESINA